MRATAFLPFMKTWLSTQSSPSRKNDAKYEQPDKNQPFIRRIEIKPVSEETNLIVVGFDPEREPLDEIP